MKKVSILPADTYIVVNKTMLNDGDRKTLTMLYQPIIGYQAISLYFSFWADLDQREIMSNEFTHHHLMSKMQLKLTDIVTSREKLEALGLVKTYFKKDVTNSYVYELYSPISVNEFLSNPILNVVLYSNVGKTEYDKLIKYFSLPKINLKDYDDISVSFSDIYTTIPADLKSELDTNLPKREQLDLVIEASIDFNLLIESIPNNLISDRAFNKSVKDLISKLAFVYNLDSLQMQEIIRHALTEKGTIDKELLRKACRNFYQFEHAGSLPTIIYRSQPEYLKTPVGDTSKRARMIYTFENTTPYDFLRSKYNNAEPTTRDLKLLESLMIDQGLKPGVVNVLIDYVLLVNNHKLTKAFVETIAGQWSRLKIETVEEAMNIAEKEHKKYQHKTPSVRKNLKKAEKIPSWFGKDIKIEKASIDEQKEIEAMLKEFS
ncbi:MAG: replication initiation and membrane attachment family protein [Bacilli bacterium]|nr:DnaD domain protein [Bacilli bacterium]